LAKGADACEPAAEEDMAKITPNVAALASSARGKTGLGGDGLREGAERLLAALVFTGVILSLNS
jgi:hypothetical protein